MTTGNKVFDNYLHPTQENSAIILSRILEKYIDYSSLIVFYDSQLSLLKADYARQCHDKNCSYERKQSGFTI